MRAPGSRDDPIFTELKAWRDRAVRQSRIPLGAFKDSYLRSIARSGRRTAGEIERMLPTSLRPFAAEVAAELERLTAPPPDPRHTAAPSTGSTPGGRQRTSGPATNPPPYSDWQPQPTTRPGTEIPDHPERWVQSGEHAQVAREKAAEHHTDRGQQQRPEHEQGPELVEGLRTGETDSPSTGSGLLGSGPGRGSGLDENRFAPYDYSEPVGAVSKLAIAPTEQGLMIRWAPAEDGQVTAYRLVGADDSYPPYAPDQADLIALTTELSAVDGRPFAAAVRHLQVWSNSGGSVDELYLRQPRLIAEGAAVAPVQNVDIAEDQGQVIARWNTLPGVTRVHVFRVPAERAARGVDQQFRILADQPCLGGFVDRQAERGRRYVYFFQTEAGIEDKALLSAPVRRELTVSAVLEAVDDLVVAQGGDDAEPVFGVAWRRPSAGRVVIYRTPNGPSAGAEGTVVGLAALPGMELKDEALLTHPLVQLDDGRDAMTDVPWPREWDRAYLTPVTILDGRAKVGRSVPAVRVHQVTDPVLVERCDEQIVKFGWPAEAAAVVLQVTALGQSPVVDQWQYEISHQRYDLLGGFVFSKPLPATGCRIHLAGRSYTAGRAADTGEQVGIPVQGKSISIDYRGLLRLRYGVRPKRGLLRREIGIQIAGPQELLDNRVPPFVLVHHPDRLPLHPEDGEPLEVTQDIDEVTPPTRRFQPRRISQQPADCAWKASVKGLNGGFVRLFVDVPPQVLTRVALLDPAVDDLRLR